MKTLKVTGMTLLILGFLWLGMPRCTEVETLEKLEREQVAHLCQLVLRQHFLTVKPEMLSPKEWRVAMSEYRQAEALDAQDLERQNPAFPDHASAVIERLAARLK